METQNQTSTRTFNLTFGLSAVDKGRIVLRIAKDHAMDETRAAAVFEETLRFLTMAATHPDERFAPSLAVDDGWHTFLLYTKAYRVFCRSLGRNFIDHEPNDLKETAKPAEGEAHCGINCRTGCDYVGETSPRKFRGTMHTVGFMEANGIAFNCDLWPRKAKGDCLADPCTCEGGGACSTEAKNIQAAHCSAGPCTCSPETIHAS